ELRGRQIVGVERRLDATRGRREGVEEVAVERYVQRPCVGPAEEQFGPRRLADVVRDGDVERYRRRMAVVQEGWASIEALRIDVRRPPAAGLDIRFDDGIEAARWPIVLDHVPVEELEQLFRGRRLRVDDAGTVVLVHEHDMARGPGQ